MPRCAAAFLVLMLMALATPAGAQDGAPFLLLNQERILTGSRTGQALLAEEEAARDALRAEARAIDQRFEEEERRLTELRGTVSPEEFREIADEFDERVVEARRQQDARSTALVVEFDQRRRQFYAEVAPILVRLLSRFGAHAILDESSVLLADQSLNITDAVIAEIDAQADGTAGGDAGSDTEGTSGGDAGGDAGEATAAGDAAPAVGEDSEDPDPADLPAEPAPGEE
jgi:Skp family chaperone for outer membrane proteins